MQSFSNLRAQFCISSTRFGLPTVVDRHQDTDNVRAAEDPATKSTQDSGNLINFNSFKYITSDKKVF
jgi:hypothetical protein